jgi:hypothetical protein
MTKASARASVEIRQQKTKTNEATISLARLRMIGLSPLLASFEETPRWLSGRHYTLQFISIKAVILKPFQE